MILTNSGVLKLMQRIKSFIASQLNTKASAVHTHTSSEITDLSNGYVDLTSAQTIGGIKTFNRNMYVYNSDNTANTPNLCLKSSKIETSSQGNTAGDQTLIYIDKNNVTYAYIKGAIQSYSNAAKICAIAKDNSGNLVKNELQILAYTNGNKAVIPTFNNESDLGLSNYKWKDCYTNAINGLNPGALSLPSTATGCVDIKSTVGQYLKDNNTNIYEFTAPFDGWVCVGIVKGSLRIDNSTTSISSGSENLGFWHSYTIPFMKNNSIEIKINKMDPADDYVNDIMWRAYIYPCQGNV